MPEKLVNRFENLGEIAHLINSGGELDAVLDLIVYALCAHSDWSMSGVLSVDEQAGVARVVKRFDPYQTADKKISMTWDLATSPVAEVVRSQKSLVIADAMDTPKYPDYRKDARARGYHTTVILPLLAADSRGRPMVLSVLSRDVVDVSDRELSFLRMVSDFASIAMDKTVRIEAERNTSARLRRSVEVYTGIMRPVIEGGSLLAVAGELNRIFEQPWLVVDLITHEIISHTPPACFPYGEERWRAWTAADGKRQFVAWSRDLDPKVDEHQQALTLNVDAGPVACNARISPLIVDGETVGALYLFTSEDNQDNLDRLQIQAVRLALSAVLMRGIIGFRCAVNSQDEIVRRLFAGEWENRGDFMARASAAGVMLNQPLQILIMAGATKRQKSAAPAAPGRLLQLTARLVKELFDGYVTVEQSDTMVSLLPACDRDNAEFSARMRRLQATIELNTSGDWVMILSDPCEELGEFGQLHRRCKRILTLARSLGVTGLVSTQYFGSLPLLLSMADNAVVEEFLDHTIHRIERIDPKHGRQNLETLRAFVNCEGRLQPCAKELGIHVSTLRYRLEKLNERCGISATCATTRFDLQIAFRLHDLLNSIDTSK